MKRKKVIGLGLACLDQLLLWRDVKCPVAGNRIIRYEVQGGGMVGTGLVAVARLGGRAEYWGAVGDDWMGELIIRGLRDEGVDVAGATRVAGQRGPTVIVCVDQPTAERHFLHMIQVPEPEDVVWRPERLKEAGCLLVDCTHIRSGLAAAAEARRLGVPVVGDVGSLHEANTPLLPLMDHAILSEDCVQRLGVGGDLRAACGKIQAMGPRHVAVTLGDRGLVSLEGDRFVQMNAFAVDVVDTTGAGDTFHGAFCYGLVEGFPREFCLALASAAAAMKCRKLGGRAGIPSRAEVRRFLLDRGVAWPRRP